MITKLRGQKVVGMYVDEKSEIVAFMLENSWVYAYKYMPDAGICFGEYRIDESVIGILVNRDPQDYVEVHRTPDE